MHELAVLQEDQPAGAVVIGERSERLRPQRDTRRQLERAIDEGDRLHLRRWHRPVSRRPTFRRSRSPRSTALRRAPPARRPRATRCRGSPALAWAEDYPSFAGGSPPVASGSSGARAGSADAFTAGTSGCSTLSSARRRIGPVSSGTIRSSIAVLVWIFSRMLRPLLSVAWSSAASRPVMGTVSVTRLTRSGAGGGGAGVGVRRDRDQSSQPTTTTTATMTTTMIQPTDRTVARAGRRST